MIEAGGLSKCSDTLQDPERLRAEAERVGYPVLLKAVLGGGGKGLRGVESAAAIAVDGGGGPAIESLFQALGVFTRSAGAAA